MRLDRALDAERPVVRISMDQNDYSHGYAFLTYQSQDDLQTILEWDGDVCMAWKIRVERAKRGRAT